VYHARWRALRLFLKLKWSQAMSEHALILALAVVVLVLIANSL
jgi:hypothetical protein